ncbi:hypothetical protein [Desulforamulus ferrireducens]|uniref:Uncharacterized protein n=1 Tax=Desulforamulus ferrireducens TaxID=1833852 RepID=A0A1S6IWZ9_9FIRM|nr:hypothetical protein [Desulforamulus ferrireducens]AQS59303.1 hypothetical protein B0537_09515 [Desulforamulus ferrireducens]
MSWNGLKLPVIFLSFIFGLAIAFGGQWVYQEYTLQQPLNKVLAENKLVEEFTVDQDKPVAMVKITLTKDVKNLMEAYAELQTLTGQVMGKKPFQLELVSKPDTALEEVFYASHHVIYQAQVNGSFPEVAARVQQAAQQQGAEGKVYVDQNNIYIQLTKADGHYLYKVIPRQDSIHATAQGGGQIAQRN